MAQLPSLEASFPAAAFIMIPVTCIVGLLYAFYCYKFVATVRVNHSFSKQTSNTSSNVTQTIALSETKPSEDKDDNEEEEVIPSSKPTPKDPEQRTTDIEAAHAVSVGDAESARKVAEIYELIREGASAFLWAEYKYLAIYVAVFSILIFVPITISLSAQHAVFTVLAFLIGAFTSIVCGFIGMKIATYSNARTALKAKSSLGEAFHVAFSGGSVMGFSLVSLGLLVLCTVFAVFIYLWLPHLTGDADKTSHNEILQNCMRSLAGFGIGASSVALFARVGGGIYTKAADVGADLVGKVEAGIPEDDPRNPATIADNVGDNVGDIAGMGADLFGSFAGSTCASFVLASHLENMIDDNNKLCILPLLFGLAVSAAGIVGCFLSAIVFRSCFTINTKKDVKKFLSRHELLSTLISMVFVFIFAMVCFPKDSYKFTAGMGTRDINKWVAATCVSVGLIGGYIIGYITEYYTSTEHRPVREVAESCKTGAATNIIYGLALGYISTGIPVIVLSITIWVSMHFGGMYGVSLATLGILTTLCTALSVDAFGPIADNAGGIAEMAELGEEVRDRTDALDATGNTTAAIGKGFAIGSAGLVGVALIGAFQFTVSPKWYYAIIDEFGFVGLLIGAMLPYIFSALTMKAVGKAALEMVQEVRRQFRVNPGIMDGTVKPDCDRCIMISTQASLREMIVPGLLVILTPILFGFVFGTRMVVGILAGALVSGVQLAVSASNTGGAWDNAKKYIEAGLLSECDGKGSEEHKAAVIGDTVGDPLKDTSGPALNILIKLMGIISVVFAKPMMKLQTEFTVSSGHYAGQHVWGHSGCFSQLTLPGPLKEFWSQSGELSDAEKEKLEKNIAK